MLALKMPAWLTDIWTVYGDIIMPVLVTLVTSIITAMSFKIRTDAKINLERANTQIDILKNIANKENTIPVIEAQAQEIITLKKSVDGLADLFNTAFQNSSIDPQIKTNLTSLTNKVKYGSEGDLVKTLEAEKQMLLERLAATEQSIINNTNTVSTPTVAPNKRTRR